MKLIFMLEELSMKELLDRILPRILPKGVSFQTIPHAGKRDLELSLPRKLRAWNEPDVAFVIVHDQDSNDCVELKRELQGICAMSGRQVLIRIACRELEAWYWGDLAAVSEAYGVNLNHLAAKSKYRNQEGTQTVYTADGSDRWCKKNCAPYEPGREYFKKFSGVCARR